MSTKFFIDILNIDDYIRVTGAPEVTTSILFNMSSSEPHPQGLLSYELFGFPNTPERKEKYGYINLNAKFIHPHVMKMLLTLNRSIYKDIINGIGTFTVDNGQLKRIIANDGDMNIPKNAKNKTGTGVQFLYEVWDLLDFSTTPDTAQQTKEYRDTLAILKKNEIFIDKFLVIPAFYRDVDLNTNKRNEFNSYYAQLIELASMIKQNSLMFSIYQITDSHRKINQILSEIYDMCVLKMVCAPKGYTQNSVIGKNTEYSARLVISCADFNTSNPDEAETSYTHVGLPLCTAIKIFLPFIAYGLRQWFNNYFGGSNFMYAFNKDYSIRRIEIDPLFEDILSIKNLQKRVNLFEESKRHRVESVCIRGADGEEHPVMFIDDEAYISTLDLATYRNNVEIEHIKTIRPLNWTELFYIIAEDVLEGKMVHVTRYPIEDQNSMYPAFFNLLPGKKFKKKVIDGKVYKRYPDFNAMFKPKNVDPKNKVLYRDLMKEATESELCFAFNDTLKLFPTYLAQLTADFDGLDLIIS